MKTKSVFVAALAALSLTGCAMGGTAPTAPEVTPTLAPSQAPTGSITVWSWDVAAEALQRLATVYEASHPGTTINVTDIGYDNAYDKISVGLQAGTGLPDLLTIETEVASGYIAQFPQGFANLDSVIGDKKADFDQSKWSAATGADGSIYMIPWDSGPVALFYRSDYLQAAGVDPNSLATWDDLIAAGEKVKAATGHTLWSLDISTGSAFTMLMQQQGAGIFDANGNISVNGQEGVASLTILKTMYEKGLLKNVKGWDARVSSLKAGDSAFHPGAVWWIGTLESEMPELSGDFAAVPLPAFANGVRTSADGGSNLAIPAQAKNPELAADFATWLLADPDNQASMMQNEGLFPAYLPALSDPIFSQPDPFFGGQQILTLFAGLTGDILPINYTSDYAKASDIVANAVVAAVVNGKDPKTELDKAAQQIATSTGRQIAS